MIGLQRGLVLLESHQTEWTEEAKYAMKTIHEVLGGVLRGCEHVGSSSVEGLEAKPIIDIVVGVDHLDDVIPFIEALDQGGFIRRPDADVDDELFFASGNFEADTRTHHVHVVMYESERWFDYIDFRDALRRDKELRCAYQDVKRQLAQLYPNNRQAYNEGKNSFIRYQLKKMRMERIDNSTKDHKAE